ncbi:putative mitochondrial protein, partial [Mucuna pruriens]
MRNALFKILSRGKLRKRLYYLEICLENYCTIGNVVYDFNKVSMVALWYLKFGHVSYAKLNIMCKIFPLIKVNKDYVCDICYLARQKRIPYTISNNMASKCFELLHFDIWEPHSTNLVHGAHESTKQSKIQNFVTLVENQFNAFNKVIQSDNGLKFLMHSYYIGKGILYQHSYVKTLQQSRRVEQKHKHIKCCSCFDALVFPFKIPMECLVAFVICPLWFNREASLMIELKNVLSIILNLDSSDQQDLLSTHVTPLLTDQTNTPPPSLLDPLQILTFALSSSSMIEPSTYSQVRKEQCWLDIIQAKLKTLQSNHTWDIVDKSHGATSISSKWMYKIKRKANDSVKRIKAQLVAKRYTQIEGVDYFGTFSPFAKLATLHFLIALASTKH